MSDLVQRLNACAHEFVLELYPHARREGNVLVLEDGLRVHVLGLKAGTVEMDGGRQTLLDLAALAKPQLGPAEFETWCEWWLSEIEEGVSEGGKEQMAESVTSEPEPEEITAKAVVKVQRNGADLRQQVSQVPDIHRLLPQSPDAEKGLLCSLVREPRAVGALCRDKGIYAGHFHIPAHKVMFDGLQSLYEDHEEINFVVLTEQLRKMGQLEAAGGAASVTKVSDFVGTALNAENYAVTVKEKYAARQAIKVGTMLCTHGYNEQCDVRTLVEKARAELDDITGGVSESGIRDLLSARAFDVDNPPPNEPVIFSMAGVDNAFDCHTLKGKRAGNTKADFFREEQKALKPWQPGLFDDLGGS